jgi:Skp family chaperone for outer membrane proteins
MRQSIRSNRPSVLAQLAAVTFAITLGASSVEAANTAQTTNIKMGYFNLALVKAAYPEAKESEDLRDKADAQLKREVDESNARIAKAREEHKSAEEIKKMTEQFQIEVNAKQKALMELVQSASSTATQKILGAVNSVARQKGLDLVVDGAGVYAGGQKVLDNGVDITEDIVKELQGPQLRSSSSNTGTGTSTPIAPRPAAAPTTAPAKGAIAPRTK